jgi:unsaturated rhamnogalacturonyl hydrolase
MRLCNRTCAFILFMLTVSIVPACHEDDEVSLGSLTDALEVNLDLLKDIYEPESVGLIMEKTLQWQLRNPVSKNDGNGMLWARSAFFVGVMATAQALQEEKYFRVAQDWGESRGWKMGNRYDHADDHSAGQVFTELHLRQPNRSRIEEVKQPFDQLMQEDRVGRELYWWADALFMSPPVLARLYAITGDEAYLDFLADMWWDSYEFLYDQEDDLFFQSHWFFEYKTPNGFKTFWARANGWVMAGTVRVLQYLPTEHQHHARFVSLHQAMAERIVTLQQEDGLWRPSLLDSAQAPYPETSSTGFFTYALAWGVNQGYLDREIYQPHIKAAWKGMVEAIHPDGMLGWVQPGGSEPDEVTYDNYQEFGTGAFLLAGSEIYKMGLIGPTTE